MAHSLEFLNLVGEDSPQPRVPLLDLKTLRWETPAADNFLKTHRHLFDVGTAKDGSSTTDGGRSDDRERRHGHGTAQSCEDQHHHYDVDSFRPPHARCAKCASPFFPQPEVQRLPRPRSIWTITHRSTAPVLDTASATGSKTLLKPVFGSRSPRWTDPTVRAPGPGAYDSSGALTARSAPALVSPFASRTVRFGRRAVQASAFERRPLPPPPAPRSLPLSRAPRFRSYHNTDGGVAGILHLRTDTIAERLERAGNTGLQLRSNADRFASLASVVHNVPQVPGLRFSEQDATRRKAGTGATASVAAAAATATATAAGGGADAASGAGAGSRSAPAAATPFASAASRPSVPRVA